MNPALSLCTLLVACATTTVHGVTAHSYVPPQNQDGLVIYSAGCDGLFVDAKDQRLKEALSLVGARIAELPAELGKDDIPAPAIQLALRVLASPMNLRAGFLPDAPEGSVPFYAQLTLEGTDAREVGAGITGMLQAFGVQPGAPSEEHGLAPIALENMPGWIGNLDVGGRKAWVFAAGEPRTDVLDLGSLDLPQGVRPVIAFKWDMGQYFDALDTFLQMVGESTEGMDLVRMWASDGVLVGGFGYGADRSFSSMRYTDYVTYTEQLGLMSDTPLRMATLRTVPEDATYAALGSVDLTGIPSMLRGFLEALGEEVDMGDDPFETIYAMTGVHVERDLFDHFGQAYGMYLSDTTGGGGWGSVIAFAEVADADALATTLGELGERVGQLAKVESRGYVQVRRHETAARALMSLSFPGIPVPVELTLGLTDHHLFCGLSPQGVRAAIDQATAGSTSLLDNKGFAEFASGKLEGLYGVTFSDTPRLVRDGYTVTSMICAALSNATSSPQDPTRYVGSIVPPYNELVRGAKAAVGLTRIQGRDMVTVIQGDRSVLVNVAASVGLLGDLILPLAGLAGVSGARAAVPMTTAKLEDARHGKMRADVAMIESALLSYAVNNGGYYPDSLAELTVPDENGNAYLDASLLIDPWGQAYVYEPPSEHDPAARVRSHGDPAAGGR